MITKLGNTLVNQPGLLERNPGLGIGLGAAAGTLGTGLGGAYALKKWVLPKVTKGAFGAGMAAGAGILGAGMVAKKLAPQVMEKIKGLYPDVAEYFGKAAV